MSTDRTTPRPTPAPPPSKHQLTLMIWLAVFPTLTVLNLGLSSLLTNVPIVLRTFILATIAVTIVTYALIARLHQLRARLVGTPVRIMTLGSWNPAEPPVVTVSDATWVGPGKRSEPVGLRQPDPEGDPDGTVLIESKCPLPAFTANAVAVNPAGCRHNQGPAGRPALPRWGGRRQRTPWCTAEEPGARQRSWLTSGWVLYPRAHPHCDSP